MRTIKLAAAVAALVTIAPATASAAEWKMNGIPTANCTSCRAVQLDEATTFVVPGVGSYSCQVASTFYVKGSETTLTNFGLSLCSEGAYLTNEAPARGGPAPPVTLTPVSSEGCHAGAQPLFVGAGLKLWLVIPSHAMEVPISGTLAYGEVNGVKNGINPSKLFQWNGGRCANTPELESPVGAVQVTGEGPFEGTHSSELLTWK